MAKTVRGDRQFAGAGLFAPDFFQKVIDDDDHPADAPGLS